jgi:Flp pilus assembly protein TadD
MGQTETASSPRIRTALIALALVLTTLGVYYPVGKNDFVRFDDDLYVTSNPYIQSGLNRRTFLWSLTAVNVGNWHPLTMLSLALDRTLFGPEPAGFHWSNLALHITSAVLLFLVLGRMTGRVWCSAWVAALFALHPLHAESVAWVAERKDVLSALFWMFTLAAYLHYTRAPSWRRYAWVVLAFGLGLTAKSMLVTLPCVLLLLDFWPLGRLRIKGQDTDSSHEGANFGATICSLGFALVEKAPLLLLALLCSLIALGTQYPEVTLEERPLGLRLEHAVMAYSVYLRKMIWPVDLAPFYPFRSQGWPAWQIAALTGLLLGLTALAWHERRRRPYLTVGWFWYLGTLVPVIGLVQVGYQAWADRYTYLPLIGIFIVVVWGAADVVARLGGPVAVMPNSTQPGKASNRRQAAKMQTPAFLGPVVVLTVLAAGSLILCAFLNRAQISYWHNDLVLWQHALQATSDNYLAHNQLGACLGRAGRRDEAQKEYALAIAINPHNGDASLNLARSYLSEGKMKKALQILEAARIANPKNAEIHSQLGLFYLKDRPDEGLEYLRQAIRLDPREAKLHLLLAGALEKRGRLEEAAQHLGEAVQLAPDAPMFHYDLAVVLCRLGRWHEADAHLQEALELAIAWEQKQLVKQILHQREACRRERGA